MDSTYGLDSSMWDTNDKVEWDPRHRAGFLNDDQYDYGAAPPVDAQMEDEEEPQASKRDLFFGVDISGEEITAATSGDGGRARSQVRALPSSREGVDAISNRVGTSHMVLTMNLPINDGSGSCSVGTPPNLRPSVRVSAEAEWSEQPMSPTGRVMEDIGVHIISILGLGIPVNLPVFRAGIETEILPRYPRFCSIKVMDVSTGKSRWVRTKVNLDDHIIVPRFDPARVESDPEKAVEDYVASLSTLPMDMRRPLWEFHLLDFPTSEATSTMVLRVHHSIGDGMSIMTLYIASSHSTADPTRMAAMPPPPRRTGEIYQLQPRPPLSSRKALLTWVLSYLVLAWHTLVDSVLLAATILFLSDPRTMFTRPDDGLKAHHRKRLVHRNLSLDDIKLIKTAVKCTINDVLVGVTSAALSRYYFRMSGDINTKKICLRSFLLVNTRPVSCRQIYVTKVETGNQLSSLICPFHIVLHDDPLEHIRKAKMFMDRKKTSLEVKIIKVASEFLVKYFGVKVGASVLRLLMTRTTIIFSNVVGPAEKITLCGHPVVSMGGSVYGQPQALTVHYQNYGNTVSVTLAVDDTQFPNCHELLDDLVESIKLIKNAAGLHTLSAVESS
ncbi:hypothetical protein ACQ4PT_054534 [Festuca glaucescens]